MTGAEWAVLVGGAAAIAWVNWYFFLAGQTTGEAGAPGGDRASPSANKNQNATNAARPRNAARRGRVGVEEGHGNDGTRSRRG
jgi:hypothetical protein